jgi:phosphoserine phosphatase RsbU/P
MPCPEKILVVDDEKSLQSLISQKFKSQIKNNEFQFSFALNGIEALEKLKQDEEIGIILTDLKMPDMDGITLLNQLFNQKRLYRAIVVSAYGDMTNIRRAMNNGAVDFVLKPIDFKDLEITITKTIQQYHAMKQGLKAEEQMIRLNNELEIARSIQRTLIPRTFDPIPDNKKFTLYGEVLSAKEVGGDFFDFFPISNNLLGFLIADVSGKGIPAALFMAMSRTILRSYATACSSPGECLKIANHLLCQENDASMFVTIFYGILNTNTGEVRYCNAGHNPPYILSEEGTLKQLETGQNIALGVLESPEKQPCYQDRTLFLKKNDCLFLYTDGVTEAINNRKDCYEKEQLETYLKTSTAKTLPELCKGLRESIQTFASGTLQFDDITMLALRYHG